jgi:DNA-binding MarR family transcriptional regulator
MPTLTRHDQELLAQVERAIRVLTKSLYGQPHRARGSAGDVRIDRSGYAVMGALDDLGETRLSDLACMLGLDISTVSRQVKALEEHGFVKRRPDPDDRRAGLLDLTTGGRRELGRMRAMRVDVLTAATAGWAAEDRQRLRDLLEALASQIAGQSTR